MPKIHAEEHKEQEDHFDGSEYNASSFRDINLEKTDYKELRSRTSAVVQLLRARSTSSIESGSKSARKRQSEIGVSPAKGGTEKGPLQSGGEKRLGTDPNGPVTDLPSDWVPDALKLTSNGGFTIAPDNGSPVPYRLNGHVDIQRGRP